jgi:hypothetical protein
MVLAQMVLVLPLALVYLVATAWPRGARRVGPGRSLVGVLRPVGLWCLPLAASGAAVAWFNWARFGSPLSEAPGGAPVGLATSPVLHGLHGLLASPGRSVVLFAPVVLIGLAGLGGLFRARPVLAGVLVGTALGELLLNAAAAGWPGGVSWGPQVLVPTVALAVLPACFVLARWPVLRGAWRGAILGVSLLGLAMSLLGASFASGAVARAHGGASAAFYWSVGHSQVADTVRTAIAVLGGARLPRGLAAGVAPAQLWWARPGLDQLATHVAWGVASGLALGGLVAAGLLVVRLWPAPAWEPAVERVHARVVATLGAGDPVPGGPVDA